MTKRFSLLVFDWDGTLMDSTSVIAGAIQAACRDLDLPIPSDERASHIVGLSFEDALVHVLPELDPFHYPRVVERYAVHFRERGLLTPLFPGVEEGLQALKEQGYLLGVATGKSRRGLDRALAQTGLDTLFDATRCADECSGKPHPAMLAQLMTVLSASRPATLMIGDTTHDLQMAINAGVASLGAAYGAHPRDELLALQPLGCVDQPHELWKWLAEHG